MLVLAQIVLPTISGYGVSFFVNKASSESSSRNPSKNKGLLKNIEYLILAIVLSVFLAFLTKSIESYASHPFEKSLAGWWVENYCVDEQEFLSVGQITYDKDHKTAFVGTAFRKKDLKKSGQWDSPLVFTDSQTRTMLYSFSGKNYILDPGGIGGEGIGRIVFDPSDSSSFETGKGFFIDIPNNLRISIEMQKVPQNIVEEARRLETKISNDSDSKYTKIARYIKSNYKCP